MPTGISIKICFTLVKDYYFHLDMMLGNRNPTFDHVLHIKCLLQASLMNFTYNAEIEIAGDDELEDFGTNIPKKVYDVGNNDNGNNLNVDNSEDSSIKEH